MNKLKMWPILVYSHSFSSILRSIVIQPFAQLINGNHLKAFFISRYLTLSVIDLRLELRLSSHSHSWLSLVLISVPISPHLIPTHSSPFRLEPDKGSVRSRMRVLLLAGPHSRGPLEVSVTCSSSKRILIQFA